MSPAIPEKVPLVLSFQLSDKIIIQQRVVYDVFMMFGDVGGLYDFISLLLSSILSTSSQRFLLASIATKLFR